MGIIKQRQDLAIAKNVLDYFINRWEKADTSAELVYGLAQYKQGLGAQLEQGYSIAEHSGNREVYVIGSQQSDTVCVYAGPFSHFSSDGTPNDSVFAMHFWPGEFHEAADAMVRFFTVQTYSDFDPGRFSLKKA